ncbi:MAG: DUF1902 domain-containing protein [Paracoccus sp. (in: a-proteobacteria)]
MVGQAPIRVTIGWDADAEVWVAISSDVCGLAVEGDTLDKLYSKVMDALHDLVELNGFEHEGSDIPVQILAESQLHMAHCA